MCRPITRAQATLTFRESTRVSGNFDLEGALATDMCFVARLVTWSVRPLPSEPKQMIEFFMPIFSLSGLPVEASLLLLVSLVESPLEGVDSDEVLSATAARMSQSRDLAASRRLLGCSAEKMSMSSSAPALVRLTVAVSGQREK